MYTVLQLVSFVIGIVYLGYLFKGLFLKEEKKTKDMFYKISSIFIIPLLFFNILYIALGWGSVYSVPFINLPAIVIGGITGNIFLKYLFRLLEKRYQQNWLRIIYYIGIICVLLLALLMTDMFTGTPIIQQLFLAPLIMVLTIAICALPFAFLAWLMDKLRNPQERKQFIATNRDKLQHYREQGLSEREIVFFREEMAQAKKSIENIEREMTKVAKLRVIETRYNTLEVSKQFFKDIVKEPQRLAQAGMFLNKLLPSLEDLTAKYTEVSEHVAKTKQTYLILERSAQTIEKVCESISEQYLLFHQTLFDDLDDEIKLANKAVNNESKTEINDIVDDLVSDPFQVEEE